MSVPVSAPGLNAKRLAGAGMLSMSAAPCCCSASQCSLPQLPTTEEERTVPFHVCVSCACLPSFAFWSPGHPGLVCSAALPELEGRRSPSRSLSPRAGGHLANTPHHMHVHARMLPPAAHSFAHLLLSAPGRYIVSMHGGDVHGVRHVELLVQVGRAIRTAFGPNCPLGEMGRRERGVEGGSKLPSVCCKLLLQVTDDVAAAGRPAWRCWGRRARVTPGGCVRAQAHVPEPACIVREKALNERWRASQRVPCSW